MRLRWVMLCAAILPSAQVAGARSVPASDTQWWQEIDATASVLPSVRVTASGFSRLSDSTPNPTLVGAGLGAAFVDGPWSYAAGVLFAALKIPADGARLDAMLPYLAVTGTTHWYSCTWSNRARIEDVVGVPANPWRYRDQIVVSRPLQARGNAPYLFLSDEVFIDAASVRFTRNRLLAGFGVPLTPQATTEIAYLNQDNARQVPGRIQGVSLTLKLAF